MRVQLRNGEEILIDVARKNVSQLTLKVYSDGAVRLTAPSSMPEQELRGFAERHVLWIERRLRERVNNDPDGTVRLEGDALSLEQRETSRGTAVEQDNAHLVISGPTPAARQKAFDSWWRGKVIATCSQFMDKWYPVLAQRGYDRPQISVRKMKSVWGSCTPKTGRIRFNYYLLCAPKEQIEYVVLHELAHLAYPNHGRRFAAFMTKHMPDWKERRARLNQCARYIGSF